MIKYAAVNPNLSTFHVAAAVERKIDEIGIAFKSNEVAKAKDWGEFIILNADYSDSFTFVDSSSSIAADTARITDFSNQYWFAKSETFESFFSDDDRAKRLYVVGLHVTKDGLPYTREQDLGNPEIYPGEFLVFATHDGPAQITPAEDDMISKVGVENLGWRLKSGASEVLSGNRAALLLLALSRITFDMVDTEKFFDHT